VLKEKVLAREKATCDETAAKMAAVCPGFSARGTDGEQPVIGKKHAIVAKHA